MTLSFRVRRADWTNDQEALRCVRQAVFIHEQGIPADLEWDEDDARCRHALAENDSGAPIGTGRLVPDGHIGRLAVLPAWRRQGVADALMVALMAWAREDGHRVLRLHAQEYVVGLYRRHGFEVEGEPFDEVGIPHRYMRRAL